MFPFYLGSETKEIAHLNGIALKRSVLSPQKGYRHKITFLAMNLKQMRLRLEKLDYWYTGPTYQND